MLQLPSINFLSIPVASVTMQQTVQLVDNCIRNNDHIQHVVINAGKVVAMQKDKMLYGSVVNCDLINADGQSIVWAARFLRKHLPERVAGIDLMENLVALAHRKGYKCFFFGAKEEVVRRVTTIYAEKYSPEIIAGYRNGYYTQDEEESIARQIGESGANILFVAISSPKKEVFVDTHRDMLSNVNFTMGVGGSFDVVAGVTKRAPLRMQKMGLEWFFRFIQEPGRMWKRYMIGNYQFIKLVIKAKFNKML
ncbi:MAG: WecB/TagA/CpsF family glycosyltransferase [Bacteroidales bacterium]|jgi:N-acetylglucosaminyldiphosphoundecaprenol N-acetyl-beta-D-mannosaminyltransferase|nr:WecB/TagA/CpsF family glycosyltransferase [Bacteroidales bacterium]